MRGLLRAGWRALVWLLGGVAGLWAFVAVLDKPSVERLLILGFLVLGYLVLRLGERLQAIEQRLAWIDATLGDIQRHGARSVDVERLDRRVAGLAVGVGEAFRVKADWDELTG
mgnify:CR=1 FL=1